MVKYTELAPDIYEDNLINIFILDEKDYEWSATLHPDKCLPKMILEAGQLASCAIRALAGDEYADRFKYYKSSHFNHQCSKWVRESEANFVELVQRVDYLHDEYLRRGFVWHNSYTLFKNMLKAVPYMSFPQKESTPKARCFNKNSGIIPDYSISIDTQYRIYMLTKSYTKISDPLIMYLKDVPETAVFGNPEIQKLYQQIKSAT